MNIIVINDIVNITIISMVIMRVVNVVVVNDDVGIVILEYYRLLVVSGKLRLPGPLHL